MIVSAQIEADEGKRRHPMAWLLVVV
ncbi:MAG: hypothetical protein QOF98_1566, partial [Streptomyces sp.]|nr:hypothetical protein [Streptomyces sp.]